MSINSPDSTYIQVPRQLIRFFGNDRGLHREIEMFFVALANKVSGSTATLADVEQRSNVPALARAQAVREDVEQIRRSQVARMQGQIAALENELDALRRMIRPTRNIEQLRADIDDMEKSYRPRY